MSEEVRRVRGSSRSPLRRPAPNPYTSPAANIDSPPRPSLKKSTAHLTQLQTDQLLRSLAENRENLCTCFDIYELVLQNGVPQRCIAHNNFVTLYCEFDHRLLCVNCIYGNMDHKNHRVIPIKNAFDQIEQDNVQMSEDLVLSIERLRQVEKAALESTARAEEGVAKLLKSMDDEYESIKALLTERYTLTRASVVEMYSQSRARNDTLLDEIAWLKKTYIDRQKNLPTASGEQQVELYTHTVLSALRDAEKIDINMIRELNVEDLKGEVMGQLLRIREVLEKGNKVPGTNSANRVPKNKVF